MTRHKFIIAMPLQQKILAFVLTNILTICQLLAQSPQSTLSPAPVSESSARNHAELLKEIEAFVKIPAVVGREGRAAEFIKNSLGSLPVKQDAHGSLTLAIGSGEPKRLIACQLDEPGYVVTNIQEDGYLRLNHVGRGQAGALWDQFHEGQKIVIATANGLVPGALGVRSTHLRRGRGDSNEPFSLDDAYVDVGAESVQEVAGLGIHLLDPVALIKRPMILQEKLLAAPYSQTRAAAVALADAASQLGNSSSQGTTTFAWVTLETLGRKGLEHVVQTNGPFDEVFLMSRNFGLSRQGRTFNRTETPPLGTGVLAADHADALQNLTATTHMQPFPASYTRGPEWNDAKIGYLGLPVKYADTPVEMVHIDDVKKLSDTFVQIAGGNASLGSKQSSVFSAEIQLRESMDSAHKHSAEVLSSLIAKYGVSGDEVPVREQVESLLPAWAKAETDTHGNLLVTFGQGNEHIVFVAHIDEVGFRVQTILEDGRLQVERRGGLYPSLWEAQAAFVHGDNGNIPAVFEPRQNYYDAEQRTPTDPLTVYLGVSSREEAVNFGVEEGKTTVTMPKKMLRIGKHRVLARGFDDRVGSSALVLAAEKIDPKKIKKRVTFAWVVEEEVGLFGSQKLSKDMKNVSRVYPVDTFVSSDAPLESVRYAFTPLGKGVVLRAMDNSNLAPRYVIDEILALAKSKGILVQYGMTSGGNDGAPFLVQGAINLPLSWPGRYSHSPVEVADLRDLDALVNLMAAIVME